MRLMRRDPIDQTRLLGAFVAFYFVKPLFRRPCSALRVAVHVQKSSSVKYIQLARLPKQREHSQ
jgi:hypothetical protein